MGVYEDRNEEFERRLRAAQERFEQKMARLGREILKAGEDLQTARDTVAKERAVHERRRNESEVLVRHVNGAPRTTYHDAVHPCGRVRDPEDFKRMLISDAAKLKLRPCRSCATPAMIAWQDRFDERVRAQAAKKLREREEARAREEVERESDAGEDAA